jgi:hypothetical protein
VGPAYNGRRKFVTPDDRFDHPHWVAVDDREAHIKVLHAGDDRVTYGETAERALKMRAEDWIRVYGRYYETGIVNKGMGYTWFGAKESPMANFEIPMQADNPAAARYLTLSAQHRAHVEAAIANKQRGEISQLVRDEYTDLFPPKAAPAPAPVSDPRSFGTADQLEMGTVSRHFMTRLLDGHHYKTIVEARKEVGDVLGMTIERATPLAKQVEEAVELGVVRAARQIVDETRGGHYSEETMQTLSRLRRLYQQQPKLGTRDRRIQGAAGVQYARIPRVSAQPPRRRDARRRRLRADRGQQHAAARGGSGQRDRQ